MSKIRTPFVFKIPERKIAVSVLVSDNIKLSDSVLIVCLLRTITENLVTIKTTFEIDNFAVRYLMR
jgi:hypothetical protein